MTPMPGLVWKTDDFYPHFFLTIKMYGAKIEQYMLYAICADEDK